MSYEDFSRNFDSIHRLLLSSKATQRKEGLGKLNQVLGSIDVLQFLDHSTLSTATTAKIKVGTWPGLCVVFVDYAAGEISSSAGKKRGPDVNIAKTLRHLVQLADDDRRSGRRGLLSRKIGKLFSHVKDTIKQAGLASTIGQEYSALLRTHLLPVDAYCNAVSCSSFEELLDIYMSKLEENIDRSEDTFRHMSSLLLLLQQFPGDMQADFQQDMVTFFAKQLPLLDRLREDARISTAFVSALNAFLLKHGLDVASRSVELQQALQPFFLQSWKATRDFKLRDSFVICLRIQLQLKGIQGMSGAAEDIQAVLDKELAQTNYRWGNEDRQGDIVLSRQEDSLLHLTAALHHLNARSVTASTADTHRSKKPRVTSAWTRLYEQAQLLPWAWMPVLAMLIHNHSHQLPQSAYTSWLHAASTQKLDSASESAHVLWTLRFLHELVLAWSRPATPAAGADTKSDSHSKTQVGQWKAVGDNIVTWMSTTTSKPAVQECAAAVLSLLTSKGLMPHLHLQLQQLWSLPAQTLSPVSIAHLTCATSVQGPSMTQHSKSLQQNLPGRLLTSWASDVSPDLILQATLMLCSSPSYAKRKDGACSTSWLQPGADTKALQQQINALARGKQWMAQLAQQARNMQVRHATDTAAAAAAAAISSNSSEPPGPAQHAAGELLQQQLQLLTVDSQEAEQVLLAQLLRACTVTLGLMAAFDLASGSHTLWRSQGAVQEALQLALQRISSLIAGLVESSKGIQDQELRQIKLLVDHLQACRTAKPLFSALLKCLSQLDATFQNADTLATTALVTSAQLPVAPGVPTPSAQACTAAVSMFDDDLDTGVSATVPGSNRPTSASTSAAVSLATSCRMTCVSLITALGTLDPVSAAGKVTSLLQWCHASQVQPPPELVHHLLVSLCELVAAPGGDSYMKQAIKFLDAEEGGLLAHKPFQRDEVLLVLQQLAVLAKAFLAAHGKKPASGTTAQWSAAVEDDLDGLMNILDDVLKIISVKEGQDNSCTSWQMRVQLAAAILDLILIDTGVFGAELLTRCLSVVSGLLADDVYFARREAGRLVTILYQKWARPQKVFEDLKPKLSLYSLADTVQSTEHIESAILMLGETAASCGVLEREAVFLLCGHAAKRAVDKPLVQAALDMLAARLGYASRATLMAYHKQTLVFDWCCSGYSLQQFLAVQDLVAVDDRGGTDERLLASSYLKELVPVLLLDQREEQLQELATMTGIDMKGLLSKCMDSIIGSALPYVETGDAQEKELATTITQGGILKQHITDEEQSKLFAQKAVSTIGTILLTAADEQEPARPFFPVKTVLAAILRLAGQNNQKNVERLWGQVLKGDAIATLLLTCHQHLHKAKHPRHATEALGPLKALVLLLGDHVKVPSTFRYLINILLQQLDIREMWLDCCQLLESVLKKMLAHQSTLEVVGAQLQHILASIQASLQRNMSKHPSTPTATATDAVSAAAATAAAADAAGDADHLLVQLMLKLTVEAPQGLHVYLRDVEPLLALPALDTACRLHQQLRQGLTLTEELTHFAGRAKSMTAALRERSLSALMAALPSRKHQLYQDGSLSRMQPAVEEAIWKLVWLSGDTQDTTLTAFTGELLALAGPLDSSAIAFKVVCSPQTEPPDSTPGSASGSSEGVSLTVMMAVALRLMADFLVDPDVVVIKSAQFTLRNLLATQLGQDALTQLQPVTQGYLQVYRRDVGSTYRPSSKDAADPKYSVQNNPDLWAFHDKPYDVWVRNLAYALLLRVQHPTLCMCQHMIVRKAELAELMLPHIFADLARHDTNSSLVTAISPQLTASLLGPAAGTHTRAMQLVLTCLDHLRNMHLDAVLGLDTSRPRDSGAASQSRSRSSRQAAQDGADSPILWLKRYWLDIDYLTVAAAALSCGAYFTALLYVEHWLEAQNGYLKLEQSSPQDKGGRQVVDQLLLDIYSSINEPDGIYAVTMGHSLNSQLKLYEHEGSWDKAMTGYDLLCRHTAPSDNALASSSAKQALHHHTANASTSATQKESAGSSSAYAQQGLLTSLQQLGCRHLIEAYWKAQPRRTSAGDSRSSEMRCENAWRMGQWNSPFDQAEVTPGQPVGTNQAIQGCLKALSDGDRRRCRSLLLEARQVIVRSLANVSTESVSSVNPAILRLQQLQCLQEAWALRWPTLSLSRPSSPGAAMADASKHKLQLPEMQAVWQRREAIMGEGGKYELREPLLALRRAICEALKQPDAAWQTLLEAAVAARQSGQLTHAMAAAHELSSMHPGLRAASGSIDAGFAWSVEEAKLLWAQGQQAVAVRMGKSLMDAAKGSHNSDVVAYARLLSLTGKWLAETRFESSSTILAKMNEAVDALVTSGKDTGQVACRVMHRLAHHADTLYAGIQAQKQSAEWTTAQAVIKQKRQQVNLLHQQLNLRKQRGEVKTNAAGEVTDRESRLLIHQINGMMRPIQFDEEESASLQDSEARYLLLALTNYHRCLLAGDKYDLQVVYRLFQLWFSLGHDQSVNAQLDASFMEIPSCKLLSLVYQIASRMSAAKTGPYYESGFQSTLLKLLERLAVDHPHHTLYQLFALKNGNRGRDGKPVQAGDVVGGMSVTVDHDKVAAAHDLLQAVAGHASRKQVVEQVNQVIEAYITLAALPASSDCAPMTFPSSLRRRNKDLHLVPVVSAPVEVDPSCRYDNLPFFTHFGDSISFVGGINKPKLIQCFDSTGRCHRQLVKSGNDDMRQDAVMQQFFALINNVLQESPDTQKRKLRIVTYKVVPFSPASGLLEWVEDTIPVHEFLTGKDKASGAHKRYSRPGHLSFAQCMQTMHKAKRSQLRHTFDHVTAHFPPVLHHFFLETFRSPAHWFERRLQYTRSVAVNSMAGYIIGLGDRHSHNILLDRKTAEVVHIDLGVAFEQGRFLNSPELVPFRLTSNIVDGMGATGVEGVMRICCEKTLGVLRQNKESLLTIIEVFIHDPLYKWALTPLGAQQRQKDYIGDSSPEAAGAQPSAAGLAVDAVSSTDNTLANADAERALLRLKQKLAGLEGGQGESRGVKGQVQQLLQDAQNPDKLCKMYVGWSAWL